MSTVTVEVNQTEKEYLTKVNFWMLLLCVAHVPFIAGIAAYFETGIFTALMVGAVIAAGPVTMYYIKKESKITSIVLGIAFMGYSALLIHHARGMIEMHFHIFTFIAMLIIFANPWVIVAAAGTIAVHHVSFYFLLPKSVFNYQASFGIVLVHAAFVVIETIPSVIIARSFSKFIMAQGSIIKNLENLSDKILRSAEDAAESGFNLSRNTKEQSEALQTTVFSIEEVKNMIQQSVKNVLKSQEVSHASKKSADEGKMSVNKMINSIQDIGLCNNQMTAQFNDLNIQLSEIIKIIIEIDSKTKVINEIVFQTKLLSFNASVEAARAGEHGKGFSVVAEEIGNLARMSGKSSQEINELLKGSLTKVESIVAESKMKISQIADTTNEKIKQGGLTADECQEALAVITSNVNEAIMLMNYINTSSDAQSKSVNEIADAMKNLNNLTMLNTKAADYSEGTSQELKNQALDIKSVVDNLIKAVG